MGHFQEIWLYSLTEISVFPNLETANLGPVYRILMYLKQKSKLKADNALVYEPVVALPLVKISGKSKISIKSYDKNNMCV